jgi:large subunit ribosomal protein L31
MKLKIHPQFVEAQVTCACGNSFTSYSTKKILKVEICSKCHPLFTGQQKIVDAEGRVEKFTAKYRRKKEETGASGNAQGTVKTAGTPKVATAEKKEAAVKKETSAKKATVDKTETAAKSKKKVSSQK